MERQLIEISEKLKISVVLPAFNEEEFIGKVVTAANKVKAVDEVLVVNDGSKDETVKVAKQAGARAVSHQNNCGKGFAMQTGCEKAVGDVLVFLDADLVNIEPVKIERIIEPFKKGTDFAKTRFHRRGGRVTQLTARPLLGHFFPEIDERFEQPLSGQIGIKKELAKRLDLEVDLGVDIGILIDVVEAGARIAEVDIGELVHDERESRDLDHVARAVSRVVLDRAAKYNRLEEAIETIQENQVV